MGPIFGLNLIIFFFQIWNNFFLDIGDPIDKSALEEVKSTPTDCLPNFLSLQVILFLTEMLNFLVVCAISQVPVIDMLYKEGNEAVEIPNPSYSNLQKFDIIHRDFIDKIALEAVVLEHLLPPRYEQRNRSLPLLFFIKK